MLFVTLFSDFIIISCSTVTLLTVIADDVARFLKTSGATQAVVAI